jgi:hypothetical protein
MQICTSLASIAMSLAKLACAVPARTTGRRSGRMRLLAMRARASGATIRCENESTFCSDPSATLRGTSGGGLVCDHTVQTVLSARQRDGMIHVLVVVPRARAQAVRASSWAPAGEPMLEALLDRGAQVLSI